MNVTIIGAGNMGRGIGHLMVSGGHDVGPLRRAGHLEGLGFLGLALQQPLGLNFQSAWKLIS